MQRNNRAIEKLAHIRHQCTSDLQYWTAYALLRGYSSRWESDHPWRTKEVETAFDLPIINPDTGRKSRAFRHAGKWDAIASPIPNSEKEVIIEHKTCSESISEAGDNYWQKLIIDHQVSEYMLARSQLTQHAPLACLYDVIRKPEIRPKKVSLKEISDIGKSLSYFGVILPGQDILGLRNDPERRETPFMFGLRLYNDTLTRPNFYFQRQLIYRTESEIIAHAQDLWLAAQNIAHTKKPWRNTTACTNQYGTCEFLATCANGTKDHLVQRPLIHSELGNDFGKEHLTHSRISAFYRCQQYHDYRYVQGLTQKTPSDALNFGTIIHTCLAEWWSEVPDPNGN